MAETTTYIRNGFANVRKEISSGVIVFVVIIKFGSRGLLFYSSNIPITLSRISLSKALDGLKIKTINYKLKGLLIINLSDLILYK